MRSSIFTAAVLAAGLVCSAWMPAFAQTLIVGNDEQGKGGEKFQGYTYAVRPPGIYHGPFRSETGCLLLETHFYTEG